MMELNYSEEDTKMHAEIEWHQQSTDHRIDQLEDRLFEALQTVEENLKDNAQQLFELSYQKGKRSKQCPLDTILCDSAPEEGPKDEDIDLTN